MLANFFSKNSSPLAKKLENVLGFKPKTIALYEKALRHKSASINNNGIKENNERLEFLGDAILDSIAATYFFKKFPLKEEGFLTTMKSRLVSRKNLNQIALKIGIKELLETNIRQDSKTILGDALEAIIGAIYLDRGFEKTQEFVVKKLIGTYMDIEHLINTEVNFKSKVIEWAQKNKTEIEFVTHEKIVNNQSVFHSFLNLKGEEKAEGMGKSKKTAEQAAAEKFFQSLSKED